MVVLNGPGLWSREYNQSARTQLPDADIAASRLTSWGIEDPLFVEAQDTCKAIVLVAKPMKY